MQPFSQMAEFVGDFVRVAGFGAVCDERGSRGCIIAHTTLLFLCIGTAQSDDSPQYSYNF